MATSLVFDKGPATGQPVHLVFGDDGGSAGNTVPLTLAATLPRLGAHISAGKRSALSVSASLPGPRVAVRLVFSHPATVAAGLPGPGVHVQAVRARPAVVHAGLPGPGVHVQAVRARPAVVHAGLPGPGVHVSLVPAPAAKVAATLPRPRVAISLGRLRSAVVLARLPGMGVVVELDYIVNTREPVISGTRGRLQDAARLSVPLASRLQRATAMPSATRGTSTWGTPLATATAGRYQDAIPKPHATVSRQQPAMPMPAAPLRGSWQDATRTRISTQGRMQDGTPVQTGTRMRYQDADRTKRVWLRAAMQQGSPVSAMVASRMQQGVFHAVHMRGVEQDGMPPPPGRWAGRPIPPVFDPCYVPPNGLQVHLLFQDPWESTGHLVFTCERHGPTPGDTVVVPIKEVYMIVNSATLIRVDGSVLIPTLSMSMALDVDSWTWSFNASVPGHALPDLEPNSAGDPVEVEATINGTAYRFLVESIGRERSFNSSTLRVAGRGRAAGLDTPYAPVMNFGNTFARTAQQLMGDVLTINGVPSGWDVDWQLLDWNVPAGVFSHQGSYITALNAIVSAAGGYLQPHNTDQQFRALARYPTPAWEWASVTPDYDLPSAVTTRETIDWVEKPRYNRVYVSGQGGGVLGRYSRAGSAGDVQAQSVVDQLITGANAVRQRGRAILSDTGRIATVGLRLPVLSETGIIPPGKFVRYVDEGVTRLGLTRSVSVESTLPTVWQNISVETHV